MSLIQSGIYRTHLRNFTDVSVLSLEYFVLCGDYTLLDSYSYHLYNAFGLHLFH